MFARRGRHRHVREAIFYVIESERYEIHDGKRYHWSADDIMTVPGYCDHQHFNSDPQRPARFVAFQSRWYSFIGHGGIEHLEDAPGMK